jgi:hypothetical protein
MRSVLRGGAAISGAMGTWVALGAVAIAPGPTVASRLVVLPPFWLLGVLLVAFGALVFGSRWSPARATPLFAALLLLAPLLPFDIPAGWLLWQGVPAAMLLAGVAVAVVAAEPVIRRDRRGARAAWLDRSAALLTSPARAPLVAAVLASLVFAFAWRGTAEWVPQGDEPHYLVITQSLLRDGDLRIDDNHERRDYLEYHERELKPDYLRRGRDGHIYSIHAPGVSALVAPAYAMGGYRAAAIFLLLVCAAGTGLVWKLAWETTGHAGAAWFGWAVVALSIPVVAHAYTIFPDGVSAVLVVCAVWGLLAAGAASRRGLALAGLAAAVLPWLHTRNAVIAAVVGLGMGVRLAGRADRWLALAAYAAVPVASAVAWFGSFYVIYGTFSPAAPYGGYTQSRPEYLLPGIPGLFFDQQYGFLATAPGFAAALIGLGVALADRGNEGRATSGDASARRRLAAELLITFVLYLLAVASYRMWWGGASAPARFLVPVLLPLGIPAAWVWRATTRAADRAALLALVTLSATLCAVFSWGGEGMLTFTTRALYSPLYEWMTRAVDLSAGLPGSFRASYTVVTQVGLAWALVGTAAWRILRAVAPARARAAAVAPWLVAVAVMAGTWGGWALAGASPLRVDSSRLAALLRVTPRSHVLLIGPRSSRPGLDGLVVSAARALPLLQLQHVAREAGPEGHLASAGPLRAGTYRLVLSPALALDARVQVHVGHGGAVIARTTGEVAAGSDGRRAFVVDLPIDVNALTVSMAVPQRGGAAWIEPLSLRDGASRFAGGRAATAERYGSLTVYLVTDRQYPEPTGMWLRPDGESVVVAQPDAARSSLAIVLRNGPRDNEVELRTPLGTQSIALTPGEARTIDVAVSADAGAAAMGFRVARGWRPSEFDAGSADTRRLGVWLEFVP